MRKPVSETDQNGSDKSCCQENPGGAAKGGGPESGLRCRALGGAVEGMRDVEIRQEPTELYKILKFENLVESGGAAKAAIDEGLVSVNGEPESRKRRKIVSGDVIAFQGEELRIGLAGTS